MKNQFIVKSLKLALAFVFVLFVSSCSDDNETLNTTDQLNAKTSDVQILAKGAKETTQTSFTESTTDCNTECIEVGEESGATSTTEYYTAVSAGKTITVSISNNATHVIFRFSSTEDIHYIKIDGEDKYCSEEYEDNPIDQATYSISIPIGDFEVDWFGCDVVSFEMIIYRNNCVGNGNGNNATFTATHNLVPVCVCDDESFNVEATNDNLDLLFTYDAETTLFDAEVKFTFPQVMNLTLNTSGKYVAPDGKEYAVNNTGNQTVLTWVGDIGCTDEEAETFSFSHLPDCGKGKDGKATIWTDMKVNDISVKNDMPPIKYTLCPL